MSYILNYFKRLDIQQSPNSQQSIEGISPHIIELAERVIRWHEKLPIPDRWQPVQLGRIAATFNTSREAMAVALHYAGFQETKTSNMSLWVRAKFNKEK